MRIPIRGFMVPALGVLSACVPPSVHQSAPAPEHALSCAQASLERMGFSSQPTSQRGDAVRARRTVDRAWVHHTEHVVEVSMRGNGTPMLYVRGERLYTKQGDTDMLTSRHPEPGYQRRLEADELLRREISQVMRECAGPAAS